nr:hypothetical protein [Tanacetum cinerariifolium]
MGACLHAAGVVRRIKIPAIETHGFLFSWDQGVVEEKEVYYPVGFEGKRWRKGSLARLALVDHRHNRSPWPRETIQIEGTLAEAVKAPKKLMLCRISIEMRKMGFFCFIRSKREACPTESGFIADQDRATIAKSSTLPYDSAPRVTSPAADEGNMQHTISERVQVLKDREGVAAKQSGDDAPIKRRSIHEGEAAVERISNESEDIARVLTSMDAATVLAGGIDVP